MSHQIYSKIRVSLYALKLALFNSNCIRFAAERSEQQKLEKAWDSEKRREKLLERDAIKMLKLQNDQVISQALIVLNCHAVIFIALQKVKHEKTTIEGKKETESMYEFKKRIRQETRKVIYIL